MHRKLASLHLDFPAAVQLRSDLSFLPMPPSVPTSSVENVIVSHLRSIWNCNRLRCPRETGSKYGPIAVHVLFPLRF